MLVEQHIYQPQEISVLHDNFCSEDGPLSCTDTGDKIIIKHNNSFPLPEGQTFPPDHYIFEKSLCEITLNLMDAYIAEMKRLNPGLDLAESPEQCFLKGAEMIYGPNGEKLGNGLEFPGNTYSFPIEFKFNGGIKTEVVKVFPGIDIDKGVFIAALKDPRISKPPQDQSRIDPQATGEVVIAYNPPSDQNNIEGSYVNTAVNIENIPVYAGILSIAAGLVFALSRKKPEDIDENDTQVSTPSKPTTVVEPEPKTYTEWKKNNEKKNKEDYAANRSKELQEKGRARTNATGKALKELEREKLEFAKNQKNELAQLKESARQAGEKAWQKLRKEEGLELEDHYRNVAQKAQEAYEKFKNNMGYARLTKNIELGEEFQRRDNQIFDENWNP